MERRIQENPYAKVISFTLASAVELYTQAKISGAETVSKATPGDIIAGTIVSLPTTYPGKAGVCISPFNYYREVTSAAAVDPGDPLKLAAESSGVQRWSPFVPGTDDPTLFRGIATTEAGAADTKFKGIFL